MCGMSSVNLPRWVALPVASTFTITNGGASGVTVTAPSKLPLKGTCSPAAAGPARLRTARMASARLAVVEQGRALVNADAELVRASHAVHDVHHEGVALLAVDLRRAAKGGVPAVAVDAERRDRRAFQPDAVVLVPVFQLALKLQRAF